MQKIKVGIIFGGQSGEHEVSLMSCVSVIQVMDKTKYDIIPIGITKKGNWKLFLGDISKIENGSWEDEAIPALLSPDPSCKCVITLKDGMESRYYLDVVFPVLHGPRGEDGTVQSLFELMNIPYVSCGVTSSAICMDKVFSKKILEQSGLPIVDYKAFYKRELLARMPEIISEVEEFLGYPCFVKPANLGSSVGISKAGGPSELESAMRLATQYDTKILVERFIDAREIECAVLGNDEPNASLPGEIIPSRDFYDYTAKYLDGDKSKLLLPAPVSRKDITRIQELAIKAFKTLDCSGMARVDFLMSKVSGNIYINELNTIPGFTRISMYPKMWEISGLSYKDLIDKLINLAFERHRQKNELTLA
ncbi:D-alanine--D-alanine ligase [Tepidanaerobacter acetatoxydans Re1]|uniref:D-alanine--D-alanine ligase n=1 Tax=Tepidanaerobacter acetatoxydans (strain DSM 21804 / JCM 16047 / Re1) TaxID=1209989 RepID=F4LU35_TEPAE|nr:D-alanine--D-alanine ligase family protein [Tepidanaerobacter acetatoxydans]AEE90561.1 D-alanine--D-alanine ligase [Tepidanaerobacter acetatoxydans Re1]CCP25077.1 D-alanine--D-alanine ligase [Tepidanaerobacter acetatoxydans Re1]